ncbi:MAG: recombination protein RecR [Omnitrophica bacterium RIFCSPLOWO2_12_FULL_50_11]|nr:MAG: recombination protein RecR [Omnitrophica bacterium RIFCSPLOWO2_12_FULL_50_11]
MAQIYSDRLEKLMKSFTQFPGIGAKSAERMVLHLLKQDRVRVEEMARLMAEARANTFFCERCNNLTEKKICHICEDDSRDRSTICVVEEPKDVASVERSGAFRGVYYVLLGALSPLDGIGPRELRLDRLIKHVGKSGVKEVILATNPNAEGEATAMYLVEAFKPLGVKTTRIAQGVPVGSHIEYVDQVTLQRALEGRTAV